MTKKIRKVPKIKKKEGEPGRPANDWDALFKGWVDSGISKKEYLQSQGISPDTHPSREATKEWDNRLIEHMKTGQKAAEVWHEQVNEKVKQKTKIEGLAPAFVPPKPEDAEAAVKQYSVAARLANASEQAVICHQRGDSSWDTILKWRANQSLDDWRVADAIKDHIKVIVKKAMRGERIIDQHTGELIVDHESQLTPTQLNMLANCLLTVQKAQRLALGLSTENIGLDAPDTNVESQPMGDQPRNLFVVEMSRGGKFQRARPRRVS